jgi:hypothetical protein
VTFVDNEERNEGKKGFNGRLHKAENYSNQFIFEKI